MSTHKEYLSSVMRQLSNVVFNGVQSASKKDVIRGLVSIIDDYNKASGETIDFSVMNDKVRSFIKS